MNKFLAIGLGAAAVVVALLVGAQIFSTPNGGLGAEPTPSATSEPTPEPTPEVTSSSIGLPLGPHLLWAGTDAEPVPITITIASPLWEGTSNEGYVCRSTSRFCAGPPDGAGAQSFEGPEYYVFGDACHWSTTVPDAPVTTVDEIIDALANQASRVASASQDITVDGYMGKKIILQVADDVDVDACEDGSLALFGLAADEVTRGSNGPGQIEEVWALDVDGRTIVLDLVYYANTPQDAFDELHAMLE